MCTGRLAGRLAVSILSGVPGNGCAASQGANAQSVLAIVVPTVILPSSVSCVCVTSIALVVSRLAGRYGTGLPITLSGCESGPLRLTMRPRILPVTSEPSAFLAIGTETQ